ncbi:ABC transporter permease [Prosthecomicrobium pneumaticum]|uniref:Putative spermidine/putrescine transport system permease protein n=1 Tax=Prosthecomicrobium pneumaticum TaxID=81895 RepID=A0A7W9L3S3_9HYPH|nr:ABC transporter permease [Prosthecomicrobium pneumaticum]MBB5754851.1 putative spermidine/putrescine transport system permease protein [Prosthecomicrobium pneumaticum]
MAATTSRDGTYLLLVPAAAMFFLFMILPLLVLFVIGFNPPERGLLAVQPQLSLENLVRFFTNPLFYGSLLTSLQLSAITVVFDVLLGFPLAYIMARTSSPRVFTGLSILVLASMQLDMTIRLYGMIVIFGNNNGLINQLLVSLGLPKLQLIYNRTGIALGLVQATLPFMVFSLISILRNLDRSYEQAARSLGASRWRAFFDITLPLATPAVISGAVIVFSLSISSYIVPILLGSSRVSTISMHLYQQVSEMGFWQFGSALGLIMLAVSLGAILVSFSLSQRYAGSRF